MYIDSEKPVKGTWTHWPEIVTNSQEKTKEAV